MPMRDAGLAPLGNPSTARWQGKQIRKILTTEYGSDTGLDHVMRKNLWPVLVILIVLFVVARWLLQDHMAPMCAYNPAAAGCEIDNNDKGPTHGYEATREDARAAFAKIWRLL